MTRRSPLRGLRARLLADIDTVGDLRAVAERREEIDELCEDLERQIARTSAAGVVTLVGATGAGKSAMLNALAGCTIAHEGVDRPTTVRPVIYAPADAELSCVLDGLPNGAAAPEVVCYEPSPGRWRAEVLIDAPDLNSVEASHRETVTALAERSDVLIVVLHRQSVVEASPVTFLDRFARRRGLVFALNRSDELSPAARDALLAQIRSLAAERWDAGEAAVVAVSATRAQAAPDSEWREFRELLERLLRESGLAGVRRHNALGTADELAGLFERVHDSVSADFAALPEEMTVSAAVLVKKVGDEVVQRLALRRAGLARMLWSEAADRWDGPGGWALRAGGLSAAGLSAGALLARRNPLLAAGAAAGTFAAEHVRRAADRRETTAVDALLPAESELAAWYEEALSPVRVRAGRLTGKPELLAVPGPDEVASATSDAVAEAWGDLIARELPAAAERSVLRFFRLLLDLPIYGLGGWVVYRVAMGFFDGRYAGIDFLLDALLLALAYLFLVRVVVRRSLAWRARQLLRRAVHGCRSVLERRFDSMRAAVQSALSVRRAALERLTSLREAWRARS